MMGNVSLAISGEDAALLHWTLTEARNREIGRRTYLSGARARKTGKHPSQDRAIAANRVERVTKVRLAIEGISPGAFSVTAALPDGSEVIGGHFHGRMCGAGEADAPNGGTLELDGDDLVVLIVVLDEYRRKQKGQRRYLRTQDARDQTNTPWMLEQEAAMAGARAEATAGLLRRLVNLLDGPLVERARTEDGMDVAVERKLPRL